MNKVDRALKIIRKRLPNSYLDLTKVQTYSKSYSMFRAVAKSREESYKQCVKFYNKYARNESDVKEGLIK